MGYYIFDADDTLQLIYANPKGNKISAKVGRIDKKIDRRIQA